MKKQSPDSVRSVIAGDLLALHRVLCEDTSGVVVNVDGLVAAANAAKRVSKRPSWEYQVSDLHLRAPMPQNALPTNCGAWLNIHVDLDISGGFEAEGTDCITDLVLNLRIETDSRDNVCCWHFDRHVGDDDGQQDCEAHPLYHFQHGGHAMKDHAELLGRSLLLPSPRLPFPPMDAVLAFDFILSNFAGACWFSFRDDPVYGRLLRDAQKRHWKPYLEKLASWWHAGPKDDHCRTLWPHLIV